MVVAVGEPLNPSSQKAVGTFQNIHRCLTEVRDKGRVAGLNGGPLRSRGS